MFLDVSDAGAIVEYVYFPTGGSQHNSRGTQHFPFFLYGMIEAIHDGHVGWFGQNRRFVNIRLFRGNGHIGIA